MNKQVGAKRKDESWRKTKLVELLQFLFHLLNESPSPSALTSCLLHFLTFSQKHFPTLKNMEQRPTTQHLHACLLLQASLAVWLAILRFMKDIPIPEGMENKKVTKHYTRTCFG
jgi:hypothetical protein